MPKLTSTIDAVTMNGLGGCRQLSRTELYNWEPSQGVLWVHLDFTSKAGLQWLKKHSGLDKVSIAALTHDDARSRSLVSDDSLLIILRSVNLNPGQDPEDMVSIRVWIEKNRIITTRRRNLISVKSLQEKFQESQGPHDPAEFLVMLNEEIAHQISKTVDDINTEVDKLEQEVLQNAPGTLRSDIADVRRQAISIYRYVSPQREALARLETTHTQLLNNTHKIQIREIIDRLTRHLEDLASARDRATVTQEELTALLSEELNNRIYLLSLIAAIFLPLTFLTGLLGINVGGIPGSQSAWGFWSVCAVTFFIMCIIIFVFRYKKWI